MQNACSVPFTNPTVHKSGTCNASRTIRQSAALVVGSNHSAIGYYSCRFVVGSTKTVELLSNLVDLWLVQPRLLNYLVIITCRIPIS